MPGREKIRSVMMSPPNSAPTSSATTVTSASTSSASPCFHTTRRSGEPLRARGADVVAVELLEHRRPLVAAPAGDELHREHEHREREPADVVDHAAADRVRDRVEDRLARAEPSSGARSAKNWITSSPNQNVGIAMPANASTGEQVVAAGVRACAPSRRRPRPRCPPEKSTAQNASCDVSQRSPRIDSATDWSVRWLCAPVAAARSRP